MTGVPDVPLVATLRRLLQPPATAAERCELCAAELPRPHRHLVDVHTRRLLCVCGVCGTLEPMSRAQDGPAAPRYRAVSRRFEALAPEIADAQWRALAVPVDLAFFFFNTTLGRAVGFYPGPTGATESQFPAEAWEALADSVPAIRTMAPDVEALLVRRTDARVAAYIVPIDACYELVGRIRTGWSGFGGGAAVREAIEDFFSAVRERSAGQGPAGGPCAGERPRA